MLDNIRRLFVPEPEPEPEPEPDLESALEPDLLKEKAAAARQRADEIVKRLDWEHEQHERRQRMDPAQALRLARARRGDH